jgi:hypothetical protein
MNPYASWGRRAVETYRSPRQFAGAVQAEAAAAPSYADLYAGGDGNVYRLQSDRWEWNNRGAWTRYNYDENVPGVAGPAGPIGRSGPAYRPSHDVGFEPGTWTRQTPGTGKSMFYSAQARDSSWRRYRQYWDYRWSYEGR